MYGEFGSLSTPALVAEITTLAGHLNAANARFLALIAELDRRKGWAEWGVKSMAHWLNWKCGIDLGAAREKVRVARALEQLPNVASAMSEGRVSYAKVRALTRVATPDNESYLLNIALCGTASHVEDVVRGYRRALDAAELTREAVQQRDQQLWWHTEPDGSMVIRGRLPAEVGALFVRALSAAVDGLPIPQDVSAETSSDDLQRSRKRRVEALAVMAETFLATGAKDLSGADRSRSSCMWTPRRSGTPARAAASWSTGRPWPRRRHAGSPVTAAWCGLSRMRRASCSTWVAAPAPSRQPSAVP